MVNEPLRPELYHRLCDCLGSVLIANEGQPFNASVCTDRVTRKAALHIIEPGEYYKVSCPFCSDTRHRLWINHRWGRYVPALQSKLLHLAICYNDNCLRKPGAVHRLYEMVFSDFGHEQGDVVLQAKRCVTAPAAPRYPGRHQSLATLWPNHPANDYLQSRGFDPKVLTSQYRVSYCIEAAAEFPLAQGRIIIPVHLNGEFRGWQARCVGEPQSGLPKYYSMPSMKKSELLYNYDTARTHAFLVVVEGVTDVWTFGPEAVALFGKTISARQVELLAQAGRPVFVLLDHDAAVEAQKVSAALQGKVPAVHLVALPSGDPGSWPTAALRARVLGGGVGGAGAG